MAKVNVYQMVTDRVIEQLEKGIIPWQKPWSGAGLLDGGAVNYVTRKPYSFLNQMLLGKEGEWLTFKQVKSLGGYVKKGAKAGMVVFFTTMTAYKKKEVDEEGNEIEVEITHSHSVPVLKYYHVFHIEDCEDIESKIKVSEPADNLQPIDRAEKVINGYLAREKNLKFQNDKPTDRAYYSPALDLVSVPMLSQYQIVEEYYSTTFHELVHSTMPEYRCNRKGDEYKIAAFGGEDYSKEELVAELGSAMICNAIGIDNEKAFNNSVSYIQGWLSKLKNNNNFIVWASSRAEKAAKYIMGI